MACPECGNMFREYLIFRSAVARFAGILDQLEKERVRILDDQRPAEAPPLLRFKATLLTEIDETAERRPARRPERNSKNRKDM